MIIGRFSCTLHEQIREHERQKIVLLKSYVLSIREVTIFVHVGYKRADAIREQEKPSVVMSPRNNTFLDVPVHV